MLTNNRVLAFAAVVAAAVVVAAGAGSLSSCASKQQCASTRDCSLDEICSPAGACELAPPPAPLGGEGEGEGEGEGDVGPGTCPDNYVHLGTGRCVAAFEMREGATHLPESRPDGEPWTTLTRDQAIAACQSLGTGFGLIGDDEWQALVHELENVGANWSGGSPGSGVMNVGNYSDEHGAVDLGDPCATPGFTPTRFPACTDPTSTDFTRKRSHTLRDGEEIWDVGGNVTEFTSSDIDSTHPGDVYSSVCGATDAYASAYGPAGNYTCGADENPFLFGCVEGSGGTIIIRGGGAGMEIGDWHACYGVFYANTNSFWNATTSVGPGFRCVLR